MADSSAKAGVRRARPTTRDRVAANRVSRLNDIGKQRQQARQHLLEVKRARPMPHILSAQPDPVAVALKQLRECLPLVLAFKAQTRDTAMVKLSDCLTVGSARLLDEFLSVTKAMPTMLRALNTPSTQLQATWCMVSIAASSQSAHVKASILAAPYLISLLSSTNTILQEQSAWAIGNIAGDDTEGRDTLLAQGAVVPLMAIVENGESATVRQASFAVINLFRGNASSDNNDESRMDILLGTTKVAVLRLRSLRESSDWMLITELLWLIYWLLVQGIHQLSRALEQEVLVEVCELICSYITIAEEESKDKLLPPALRLAGILCHENQNVIDAREDFWEAINGLSKMTTNNIRPEVSWMLANILGVNGNFVRKIVDSRTLPIIVSYLDDVAEVQMEGLHCCNSMVYHGGAIVLSKLLTAGALGGVVKLLTSPFVEIFCGSLQFIEFCCRYHFEEMVLESNAVDILEANQIHTNPEVAAAISSILTLYFSRR